MFDRLSSDLTLLAGVLSFTAAMVACLIATWRSESREAPTWRLLAVINCLCLIETLSGFRYQVRNVVVEILTASDTYGQRGWIQVPVDISLAITALIFISLFLRRRSAASGDARAATSITIALVTLFAIEMVSLHAIDAILYHPIGPLLIIGWLWAIAAAGVCLAAVRCAYRSHS